MSQDSPFPPAGADAFDTLLHETAAADHSRAASAIQHQRLDWLIRAVAAADVLPVRTSEAESARRAVLELNNLAGEALAEWIEGDIGRGIRLLPRGRRLSVALVVMRRAEARLLEHFGGGFVDDLRLLDRVTVRTSARNQFFARVESLHGGVLQEEVVLRLTGGQRVTALVTHSSVETLGLRPGAEVVALIKAPSMRVIAESESALPADLETPFNRLRGRVTSIRRAAGFAEVQVDLDGGLTGIALVPDGVLAAIELAQPVSLLFSGSAIIIGVQA